MNVSTAADPIVMILYSGLKQPSKQFPYEPSKMFQSIQTACLSIRLGDGASGDVAARVEKDVSAWLSSKFEVTSNDLRRVAARSLERHCPEAAYYYANEKSIL